jgi:hypothetical protein
MRTEVICRDEVTGDAVKLRHSDVGTDLVVGKREWMGFCPLNPSRARKIAKALTEWADKQGGKR